MKMKLSDYVAQKVYELGISHVFMITGGGAMHLNHSFGTHNKLDCIFNHHEQASAIAAESYCRLTNKLAVVNVTSGPGGTNTVTGVYGAYTDSIGMVVISGQVKFETTVRSVENPPRQLGDQEIDIVELVESITKYSVMINDPRTIRYHLEKAFHLAMNGRPGPVWLDIPLDIQSAQIEVNKLKGFDADEESSKPKLIDVDLICNTIIDKLQEAKQPVIFAGNGVRISGEYKNFINLIDQLGVPVVTGWNAHDLLWNTHPYYVGRPGTVGDRAGNFVVQSADLILILGSRLNIRQVSYNWKSFAKYAYKIWVDIDSLELSKSTIIPDMPINADLKDIIPSLLKYASNFNKIKYSEWVDWGKERQRKYPVVLPEYWNNKYKINPYCFMDTLFNQLEEEQIIVAADGSACVISFQTANIKKNQRLWTNSGCAAMGYDLPAAIGACVGSDNKPVVCLAGDGSIMLNLQELQTISGNNLPIKIFILNNSGYVSISQTHKNFFNGVEVGASIKSGLTFPDFSKISNAFEIPFYRCKEHKEMEKTISDVLKINGPVICEVILDENQPFAPKLASKQLADGTIVSPELEDMAPFLSEDEVGINKI
jgi:acetolactate synthase I/II/III large subunit